jgi:iron complex transport system substrate-binding protein
LLQLTLFVLINFILFFSTLVGVVDASTLPEKKSALKVEHRIIALAPHLAQLAYSAGAGSLLVAVSEYTPTEIGNAFAVNWTLLAQLKPTLVLTWGSGTSLTVKARLKALGIATFESEPSTLSDIVQEAHDLANKLNIDTYKNESLSSLKTRFQALQKFNEKFNKNNKNNENLIPTFHPVWHKPLMTINGQHVLTDAMRYCGARNIFAKAKGLTPIVSLAQVLREQPKVIIMTAPTTDIQLDANVLYGKNSPWYTLIHAFPNTVQFKPIIVTLNGERFHQPGPSLIDETLVLCKALSNLKQLK